MSKSLVTISGMGIGTALSVSMSWEMYHDILWAILHGVCSWFYVIYYAIKF